MSRLITLMFLFFASAYVASSEISIIHEPEKLNNATFIDIRDSSKCKFRTIQKSKCIPINGLINKDNIISFRDFYWLLSVNNLNHLDQVVIFGKNMEEAKLFAGMLYLAGHKKIYLLDMNIKDIYKNFKLGKGIERGLFRTKIYEGELQSHLIMSEKNLSTKSQRSNIINFVNSIIDGTLEKVQI